MDSSGRIAGRKSSLAEISSLNDVAENLILHNVDQWLTRAILRDRDMTQDFREAMAHLCLRRMEPDGALSSAPILEWLRGELRALGAIRPIPIGAKITRHNGRAVLRSLCHWLALCKCPGIVVVLDIRWIGRADRFPGRHPIHARCGARRIRGASRTHR